MKYYKNGKSVIATVGTLDLPELTEEEYASEIEAARKRQAVQTAICEATRPMTVEEVSRMVITAQINTLTVDDNTALRMLFFYPEWAADTEYTSEVGRAVGYKVQRAGKLWRLRTEHTSQTGWEPGSVGTESLWEQINETHAGTLDDPIPYSGNMTLENGKYYMQDYVIYLCNRDTVNPVYNALSELVGLYVEEVV